MEPHQPVAIAVGVLPLTLTRRAPRGGLVLAQPTEIRAGCI